MTALTRGPLPARVYWRRRLLLVLVVLGLVVGTVRLFGLGSGDDEQATAPQASQAAAETRESGDPEVAASDTPSEERTQQPGAGAQQDQQGKNKRTKRKRDRGPVLAEPEGVCADRDVAVTPSVEEAVAGSPVTVTLELRTITTPACTWRVSPATMTVKLTSGSDAIWTSQDCPGSLPRKDVVVRSEVGTEVEVTWSGRRSDDECSRLTDWALPGWYYVDAAALAGEPSDLHFELEKPQPEVRRQKVKPEKTKQRDRQRDGSRQRDRG